MRKASILFKDKEAGVLIQHDDGSFTFQYNIDWMVDHQRPSIALTLPKKEKIFHSKYLFPFFFNMLPEGSNKELVCKHNRIDTDDYFGLLMITATNDAIGAVRVVKVYN